MRCALAGDRLDVAGDLRVDLAAGIDQLVEVVVERVGEDRTALGDLGDLRRHDVVDAGAALVELGQIVFELGGEQSRRLGELLRLGRDDAVDRTHVALQRLGEEVAAFREPVDMAGNQTVDARHVVVQSAAEHVAAIGQLGDLIADDVFEARHVGFQRLRQNVAAGGDLVDLLGDEIVELAAGLADLLEVGFSRARARRLRPSASFSTWAATVTSISAREPETFIRSLVQRLREDVAAFGDLLDLAHDEPVDAGAALGRAWQGRLRARA